MAFIRCKGEEIMPKVGKKHFSYSEKGKKAAKAHAKKTGQSVDKYYGGGSVDPFSTKNPTGVPAQEVVEAQQLASKQAEGMDIPTTNAMDRSQASPDTTEYKDGGPVSKKVAAIKEGVRTRVQDVRHRIGEASEKRKREKARKKSVKKYPITGIAKPKPKVGPLPSAKLVKVPSNPPLFKGDTTKEKVKNVVKGAVNLGSFGLLGNKAGKKRKKK